MLKINRLVILTKEDIFKNFDNDSEIKLDFFNPNEIQRADVVIFHDSSKGVFKVLKNKYSSEYTITQKRVSIKRKEVYEKINSERDYQDNIWGNPEHDEEESLGDFLIYIKSYLDTAMEEYTSASPERTTNTMDTLRKVAALCVACAEQYDMPKRSGPYKPGNSGHITGSYDHNPFI